MTYITDLQTRNLDIVFTRHKYLNCLQKANIQQDILTKAV